MAIADLAEVRVRRHCDECQNEYEVSPRYKPPMCPSCLGQRRRLANAQRANGAAPNEQPTPTTLAPEAYDSIPELAAMHQAALALEGLDGSARSRVLWWLTARYGEATGT